MSTNKPASSELSTEDEVPASLCETCVVDPDVRTLVQQKMCVGRCGVCGRFDRLVRDPNDFDPVAKLIRAIIRYEWDEFEYNHHWGGDYNILRLLTEERRPILHTLPSDDFCDDIEWRITEPVYPSYDNGICLYAGHDQDGTRGLLFALKRDSSSSLPALAQRLHNENFYDVSSDLYKLIAPFIDDLATTISVGKRFSRARIGYKCAYQNIDEGFLGRVDRVPWSRNAINAPPASIASAGRLNRAGVAMLYLADAAETAIAEVRPHPGQYVSLGTFETVAPLKVADFGIGISAFAQNDRRLQMFAEIAAFDRQMSIPIAHGERNRYLPSQLLAEVLREKGFDGIRYRSSLTDGVNLCVFRPQLLRFCDASSSLQKVEHVRYGSMNVDHIPGPTDGHIPMTL